MNLIFRATLVPEGNKLPWYAWYYNYCGGAGVLVPMHLLRNEAKMTSFYDCVENEKHPKFISSIVQSYCWFMRLGVRLHAVLGFNTNMVLLKEFFIFFFYKAHITFFFMQTKPHILLGSN